LSAGFFGAESFFTAAAFFGAADSLGSADFVSGRVVELVRAAMRTPFGSNRLSFSWPQSPLARLDRCAVTEFGQY
jgi:hypothetical protein